MRAHLLAVALAFVASASLAQSEPEGSTGRAEKKALFAASFLVVAANPLAADAGAQILRAGGSAVDAAIAVQLVLGLVEPQSSGIGGGAFLLHWSHAERSARSYDGRETAPQSATARRFVDASGQPLPRELAIQSGASVGVPGTLRVLELAYRAHGRLPWARLFEPAIALAESGFPMSPRLHRLLGRERGLADDPAARELFYPNDGKPQPVGTLVRNPAYASSLRSIAQGGADVFYSGAIAEDVVRAVRNHRRPGDITLADLERYRAIERAPACGTYRTAQICSMAPPSAGGIAVLQILGILERTPFARAAPHSADAVHYFAEAGRLAYADRARYIADPAFVPQPVEGLLEPSYLDQRARLVGARSMGRAQPGMPRNARALLFDGAESELAGTSHASIVDREGNAVALSTTIEDGFGSRILVRGFLLNNQLTDFSLAPETSAVANRIEGEKRPRSSMAPVFVFDARGELRFVGGSPGGPAIINYVAKALVAVLDWGLDVQAAASLPNFGSRNGPTELERRTGYERLAPELRERGHDVQLVDFTSGLHLIEKVPGGWRGGADPRREGAARGE